MDKLKDLLLDLEKKIELNISEISNLKHYNDELKRKNESLLIENNEVRNNFKSLEDRFKALKIANKFKATVRINNVKTCPVKSFKKIENATKLMLTANKINSMLINITMIFFLLRKIPIIPIVNMIAAKVR